MVRICAIFCSHFIIYQYLLLHLTGWYGSVLCRLPTGHNIPMIRYRFLIYQVLVQYCGDSRFLSNRYLYRVIRGAQPLFLVKKIRATDLAENSIKLQGATQRKFPRSRKRVFDLVCGVTVPDCSMACHIKESEERSETKIPANRLSRYSEQHVRSTSESRKDSISNLESRWEG